MLFDSRAKRSLRLSHVACSAGAVKVVNYHGTVGGRDPVFHAIWSESFSTEPWPYLKVEVDFLNCCCYLIRLTYDVLINVLESEENQFLGSAQYCWEILRNGVLLDEPDRISILLKNIFQKFAFLIEVLWGTDNSRPLE